MCVNAPPTYTSQSITPLTIDFDTKASLKICKQQIKQIPDCDCAFLVQLGNKMGGINIRFSMSMIIAIVAVEIMNTLFFTHYTPWYHYIGHRYLFTAIVCDAIVVVILKYIKDNKWTIRKWEDAATLSLWIALLYAGFHAPYVVYDPFTGSHFILTVFHKFCMSFVILYVLDHFKHYD